MQPKYLAPFTVALGCSMAMFGIAFSRPIESWPYDKLFNKAELVVIAKPLSVRDAREEDKAIPPDPQDGEYLTGVVTTFQVLHVVKGKYDEKNLSIVHFRMRKGVHLGNGPCLVSFHTKPTDIRGNGWSGGAENEYMLFLTRQTNGQFTFVSGQFDPEFSVKQLLTPLP